MDQSQRPGVAVQEVQTTHWLWQSNCRILVSAHDRCVNDVFPCKKATWLFQCQTENTVLHLKNCMCFRSIIDERSKLRYTKNTRSQGCTDLHSLVESLDRSDTVSNTVCSQCKAVSGCAIHSIASRRLFFQFRWVEPLTLKAAEKHLQRLLLTISFRLTVLTANQGRKHNVCRAEIRVVSVSIRVSTEAEMYAWCCMKLVATVMTSLFYYKHQCCSCAITS